MVLAAGAALGASAQGGTYGGTGNSQDAYISGEWLRVFFADVEGGQGDALCHS